MTLTRTLANRKKKISLSFSGVTADQLLADSAGNTRFDISDVDWNRLTVHAAVTSITGTSVTFRVLTSAAGGKTGAITDLAAVRADGSTAFATASLASATKVGISTGKFASTGATATNIADYISIFLDGDTLSGGGVSGVVDILAD